MESPEKLLPWFSLKSVPGVGNILFKRLIDRFESPERVFGASFDELVRVEGISKRSATAILRGRTSGRGKSEIDLALSRGYRIVIMSDPDYPEYLREIPDPPPLLYVYGNLDNSSASVSVVGSRSATRYGIYTAKRLCVDLAGRGITIVSGMARGIDTAAHIGTLEAKGKAIAVLGSGLEKIYPRENRDLFHRIAENGAVVSEFHLNAEPEARNFPIRNRIIAGISLGTLVVEAAQKSGSLITARLANEQGREVFAVPGNVNSFKSVGTHNLIREGAKLVVHAGDVIEELAPLLKHVFQTGGMRSVGKKAVKLPPMSDDESLVFGALGPYQIHIDDLVRKLSMDPGKLSSILLQLELKGIVNQAPGKLFSTGE